MTGAQLRSELHDLPLEDELVEEVTTFLEESSAHYRQRLPWILSVRDEPPVRLVISRRGPRLVAASFVRHRQSRIGLFRSAVIERGPVCVDNHVLIAHLDELRRLLGPGYSHLDIQPPDDGRDSPGEVLQAHGWSETLAGSYSDTLVVPVRDTEAEQWRHLRRSLRTAINRTRREGLVVDDRMSEERCYRFAERFNHFAAERGIEPLPEDTARAMVRHLAGKGERKLFLLSLHKDNADSDVALGEILLPANGSSLVYEWGWTAQPAAGERPVPVMHRLLWEALSLCRQLGLRELDLGGYWADRGDTDPINQFKLGFSREQRHVGRRWRLVLAPWRYRAQCVLRRLALRR